MLNDRPTAVTAMSNWLTAGGGYRSRVTERFYRWPLVRWKLLTGATVPPKVTQWLGIQAWEQQEVNTQMSDKPIDQHAFVTTEEPAAEATVIEEDDTIVVTGAAPVDIT